MKRGRIKTGRIKTSIKLFIVMMCLSACSKYGANHKDIVEKTHQEAMIEASNDTYAYRQELNIPEDKYQTYYEVFLYSYCDSDGDGIGDINGLISKLDYINDGDPNTDTDLGFTGIWLMPVMQSTTYHKYDVVDYYSVDKEYGTLEDFKNLMAECDKRGIKVIIDLVINHTSSQNTWFQSAIKSLEITPCGKDICTERTLCREHNPYCNYYNFTEELPLSGKYYPVSVQNWYYEGDFWSEMPDLNLSDGNLRKELEKVMSFWLDLGVGGFRLDAAKHFFPNNTEKNNEVLHWVSEYVKSYDEQNYLVAEVWAGLSEYVQYYQSGIDSIFNFAFATEDGMITKTLNYKGEEYSGQAFGKAMKNVQEKILANNPQGIDAPFLTNHDTSRGAGYFRQDADKIKMAAAMNLFMSGNVFVYYGEEIGMSGSGKDENKRAPMYWSTTNPLEMTVGPSNMEEINHKFGTVEDQIKDPLSIYQYYKNAIRIRNENPEIARGIITIMPDVTESEICAITKTYEDSSIVMLYNCSKEERTVTVSKDKYKYEGIRGYLTTNGQEIILDGETLSLPGYSVVILK